MDLPPRFPGLDRKRSSGCVPPDEGPGKAETMTPPAGVRHWRVGPLVLGALLIGLLLADIASLRWEGAGKAGVILWLLSWLALGIYAASCFASLVRDAFTHRRGIATLVMLLALAVTVLAATRDSRLLHHETTQEVACALDCLAHSPSWGYTDTCLFGYSTRQFLVPAVGAMLFGRTHVGLTFGGALYFLIAIAIFARGLLDHLEGRPGGDLAAALILSFLPHIHWFNHFMYAFEESVYPLLFGLILCGLALQWMKKSGIAFPLMIGLVLLYLVWAYTTALALFGLGLVFLCWRAFGKPVVERSERAVSLVVAGIATVSFLISWRERLDFHAFGGRSPGELLADLGSAFRHIFLVPIDSEQAFTTRFLLVFMAIALFGTLAFLDRWRGLVLGAWMWAVLVISVVLHGYDYYDISLRVHRAMVVFPVLFCVLVFLWLRVRPRPKLENPVLFALLGVSLLVGGWTQYNYVWRRPPSWRTALFRFFDRTLPGPAGARPRLLLFEVPDSPRPFENLDDFTSYFFPRLQTWGGDWTPQQCPALRRMVAHSVIDKDVFLMLPAAVGRSPCVPEAKLKRLGVFRFGSDQLLQLTRITSVSDALAYLGNEVLVSYLHPSLVEYGFMRPRIDADSDELPLRLGGVEYQTGIGMHAWCRMTYRVPPGAVAFESVVGLSDAVRDSRCRLPGVGSEWTGAVRQRRGSSWGAPSTCPRRPFRDKPRYAGRRRRQERSRLRSRHLGRSGFHTERESKFA
jgi:hypothetical protein